MIYFLRHGDFGPIKIGYSKEPLGRVATLQTASAVDLNLLGTIHGTEAEERALHLKFSAFRLRGEWFRPSAELCRFISEALGIETPAVEPREPSGRERIIRAPRALGDLAIVPPARPGDMWQVSSRSAGFGCAAGTLEDAIIDFINDTQFSQQWGWEWLRFGEDGAYEEMGEA